MSILSRIIGDRTPRRPSPTTRLAQDDQQKTPHTKVMFALKRPTIIDQSRLFHLLTTRYCGSNGSEPNVNVFDLPGFSTGVSFAGIRIVVLLVDTALPGLMDLCTPARSTFWSQASEVCAQQQAHIVVALLSQGENQMSADRALTAVAGAIALMEDKNLLAGVWNGQVLTAGQTWIDQSLSVFGLQPRLPIELWVSIHAFASYDEGVIGIITQGMMRFVGRELEFTNPESDLEHIPQVSYGLENWKIASRDNLSRVVEASWGLAYYLIRHGMIVEDGCTFGRYEAERISIRLKSSERFSGIPIIAAQLT